jgi:serine/threonine-protein kinase
VRGIVHRDLKPENLFASARPDGSVCIKLLDFGLSKLTTEPNEGPRERNLTSDAQAMGTPNYMSPEQWMSVRDVGPASDQWAVGAILFELLTGKAPFDAAQIGQICQKVLNTPPPPLLDLRPDAPPGLATVVQKCLEKNPAQRYANVGALAVALSPFAPPGTTQAAERTLKMLSGPHVTGRPSLEPLFDSLGSDPAIRAPSDMRTTSPTPLQTSGLEASAAFPPRRSDTAQSWHQAATGFASGRSNKLAVWGVGATLAAMAILAIVLLAAPGDQPESGSSPPAAGPPEEATQVIEPEIEPQDPAATPTASASAAASTSASAEPRPARPKTGAGPTKTAKRRPKVPKPKPTGTKPKDPDDPLFEHR